MEMFIVCGRSGRHIMQKKVKLGVIGGGFMAQAIVNGAVRKKFLAADQVIVSAPDEARRMVFAELGAKLAANNRDAAASCEFLLIAVKPQAFASVAEELRGEPLPVLISIMAGKTKASVKRATGAEKVARIMPNLPCAVGAGMAGTDCSDLLPEERAFVHGLFCSVGEAAEVREDLLDAVTGVSGSGPAYVYLFLQSLILAGVEQGMTEAQARQFAIQTVSGGVEMAKTSDKSLEELIAAVSSKGGTTLAALDSFRRDDFTGCVRRAVDAAVRRAKELSE